MSVNFIPLNGITARFCSKTGKWIKDNVLSYIFQEGEGSIADVNVANRKEKREERWHRDLMDSLLRSYNNMVPVHATVDDRPTNEHE